jgi:hypothetical protein
VGNIFGWVACYYRLVTGERKFTSKWLVPSVLFLWGLTQLFLPSSWVRGLAKAFRKSDDSTTKCLEGYMFLSTIFLVAGVPLWSHLPTGWKVAWSVVAVVRLGEILTQSMEVILGRINTDGPSTLLTVAIYVLQALAIFTIGAQIVGSAGFASGNDHPDSWQDFLYMTWNNMSTLGNSYAATSNWARAVVAGSNLLAILLFTILLGFGVGRLGQKDTAGSTRSAAPGAET